MFQIVEYLPTTVEALDSIPSLLTCAVAFPCLYSSVGDHVHACTGIDTWGGGDWLCSLWSENMRAPSKMLFYSTDLYPHAPSVPGSEKAQT
jgi:hypothetical protein